MTINSEIKTLEEPPLTPTEEGKVQFLGPDTVRYISPPRVEVMRQPVRNRPAPPPPAYNHHSVYPSPPILHQPMPQVVPQMVQMPYSHQYPQLIPPQIAYMPPQPILMAAPVAAPPAPVLLSPPSVSPQSVNSQPQQQVSPGAITLNINTSPRSATGSVGVGGGGALVCPKCRKGIVTRQQDTFRKKMLMCLGICCCPLTCGIPLFWLCCNYVDACACCGKNYGHRGRKAHKKKVNAVKI